MGITAGLAHPAIELSAFFLLSFVLLRLFLAVRLLLLLGLQAGCPQRSQAVSEVRLVQGRPRVLENTADKQDNFILVLFIRRRGSR